MSTELKRPITRRTVYPFCHQGRRLVVTLCPGDVLEIREERRRQRVSEPIAAIYSWMVKRDVERRRRERGQKRRASA